jgi:hypothetical protein
MRSHVEFRSGKFPPYDGEDEEINPGRFGKRLAEHLAAELQRRGWPVEELYSEDWGWVIPIRNEGFPLWVGCGNHEEWPDGFLCFVEPKKPLVRRWFRSIDTTPVVGRLTEALDDILRSDVDVRAVRWWTDEEAGA